MFSDVTLNISQWYTPTIAVPLQGDLSPEPKKGIPWGLLLWWMALVFCFPLIVPAGIAWVIELLKTGESHNTIADIIKAGDLLLALGLFASAVAFDAYVMNKRARKNQFADVALLFSFIFALISFAAYPIYKSYGVPNNSHWEDLYGAVFLWTNLIIYVFIGIFALSLRWGDLSSAMNGSGEA